MSIYMRASLHSRCFREQIILNKCIPADLDNRLDQENPDSEFLGLVIHSRETDKFSFIRFEVCKNLEQLVSWNTIETQETPGNFVSAIPICQLRALTLCRPYFINVRARAGYLNTYLSDNLSCVQQFTDGDPIRFAVIARRLSTDMQAATIGETPISSSVQRCAGSCNQPTKILISSSRLGCGGK
ncbi:hypothetical protein ACHWQZ_G008324 [Mnemiopsis leidyi]